MVALRQEESLTNLAQRNNVSRKFIYKQKDKAVNAVDNAFESTSQPPHKVLFYLPVTFHWLRQLILCLVLHCRANHRGIQKLLSDVFDYPISLGTIHNVIDNTKTIAKTINDKQDLQQIKIASQDEKFQYNQPVLAGIDIPSLYCYLLSQEDNRDKDTWSVHLLDLKKQGFNPDRVIGDDAGGLRSAHKFIFPTVPYDIDYFHITQTLMKLRRYLRNKCKSATTNHQQIEEKMNKAKLATKIKKYASQLAVAKKQKDKMVYLSESTDTLINWLQHDVFNKAGPKPEIRYELYDFILDELNQLAHIHPHRIQEVCTTLKNQKFFLLAFSEVLNDKFEIIADEFGCPLEDIWLMCKLQRYTYNSDAYCIALLPVHECFQNKFDGVEEAVIQALYATERTSSMIENLNSRLSPYFFLRREIGFGYLDLLRFYFNHTPFLRSARPERINKSPVEILTEKEHPHWLELLGYQRFKKAA